LFSRSTSQESGTVTDSSEEEEHIDLKPGGKIVRTAGGYPIAIPVIYFQAGVDNDIVRYPPDGGLRTVRTRDVSPGREHCYSSGRSHSPVPGPTTGDKKPNRPGRDQRHRYQRQAAKARALSEAAGGMQGPASCNTAGVDQVAQPAPGAATAAPDLPSTPAAQGATHEDYRLIEPEPSVRMIHDDDFSVCDCVGRCVRGQLAHCFECHVSEYEPCIHLKEFADGLDFTC
jgi:hypothetical protein